MHKIILSVAITLLSINTAHASNLDFPKEEPNSLAQELTQADKSPLVTLGELIERVETLEHKVEILKDVTDSYDESLQSLSQVFYAKPQSTRDQIARILKRLDAKKANK